ncbi:MAG: hypothetical protein LBE27_00020 [Deltaproteobacteria bacterium]|jgi:glycine cleavage system transcriptional repressor|nr:hypothetical protein [Deltaproteobacteria bacterium]
MPNVLVTIVGTDRPGIVHLVTSALFERECRISELSQTTLLGQFAGLFSVEAPALVDSESLSLTLEAALKGTELSAWVTPIEEGAHLVPTETEPYVLTISGPDSPGLIPTLTEKVASFDANIENLRSVMLTGGEAPGPRVLALELSLPTKVPRHVFRDALTDVSVSLGLSISLPHRDIFEAIHRI